MEAERWKTGLCPNWSLPKARRTEWRSLREGKAMQRGAGVREGGNITAKAIPGGMATAAPQLGDSRGAGWSKAGEEWESCWEQDNRAENKTNLAWEMVGKKGEGPCPDRRVLSHTRISMDPAQRQDPTPGVVGMGWGRGEGRDEKNLLEMETSQGNESKWCREAQGVWEGTVTESQSKLDWQEPEG